MHTFRRLLGVTAAGALLTAYAIAGAGCDGLEVELGRLVETPSPRPTAVPFPTPLAASPTPSPPEASEPGLAGLVVAPVSEGLPDYNRRDWRHWVDDDGDCQDARQEVLIAESTEAVTYVAEDWCRVASGRWLAPFTGSVVTDPGDLDIDHLVPLANAHASGGHAWTPERKRAYANDLSAPEHLVAVTSSANRAKGAKGPDEWRPPDESYWCRYATDWVGVKSSWGLTATPSETEALAEMLSTCKEAP